MIEMVKKYQEGIKYLITGVGTTVFNWIVYTVCVSGLAMEMTVSNGVSWFCAAVFSYITNRVFVFRSKGNNFQEVGKEILLFFSARVFSGVIEIFLPTILYKAGMDQSVLGIEGFAARLVVSVLIIVLNYFFNKWIVFKK